MAYAALAVKGYIPLFLPVHRLRVPRGGALQVPRRAVRTGGRAHRRRFPRAKLGGKPGDCCLRERPSCGKGGSKERER
jgi:hypothetical protein